MKTEFLLLEHDKVTEALKESEQRYIRLLAATIDYIYTVNLDHGQTTSTSHGPGCESVTGYSPADFAKDPFLWYRIIHKDDQGAVLQQVARILQGELPPAIEHRIIRRDARLRWIRNTTIPHRDSTGKLVGYDGLIFDITERKLSEEALQAERNLLRTLVDNLPDYIFAKDNETRFILDNLPHARALGASNVEEVLGRTDLDFLPAAQASQNRAAEEQVFRSGQPQCDKEESFVDSTGSRRWFSVTRVPLKDPQGKVVGLVGIKHDITGRKRSEQAVRESQERLSLVIHGSNDGVWDWNLATNEAYFSPRWKNMLGYEDAEIENRFSSWEKLIHPDDRDLAKERVRSYLAGEMPVYELEHRLRHKDGTYRWILARGVAQRDANGQATRMAGSHMDLTELKNALQQLKKTNIELLETRDQLVMTARFESMGTLAAGVAHQVKNPLQTVLLGLYYLWQTLETPNEDVRHALQDMEESVKHADSIVCDLTTLSNPAPFRFKHQSLNPIIRQCLRLLRIQLDAAGVTADLHLADDLPLATVDEAKLEQVFLNLFVNAIHAMPSGGSLTVTTRAVLLEADPAAIAPMFRKFGPGQCLVVAEIKDTGTGIKPAELPRIFDPFWTTKPVGVGTGLGLFVARMILDRHSGVIDINNAPDGGVLATVALKAAQEDCP